MAEWYEQLLELQLSRNRAIWADLQQHLSERSRLRLGFAYLAPGQAQAQALVVFLREQTDYDVEVHSRRGGDGGDGEESWLVIGTTQPTPVTLELLDDWTEWMIAAGAAEGPCAFDGWAAQLVGE